MVQTEQLSFAYAGASPIRFPDISCKKGEHWLILGQSGTGKTTLLHLLGGLLQPTSGSVALGKTKLKDLHGSDLDRFRGKNIGIVFQKPHFVGALNVEQNLQLAQYLASVRQDKPRIRQILEQLNLGHKLRANPTNLSEGEKQRVAIARALLNRPALMLADEPTSALDDANCEEVINLLETHANEEGATLLIVTHDNRLKNRFHQKIVLGSE